MADLFKDILPSIMQTKKYALEEEGDYVPFVVNRALSYHADCLLAANEMNRNYEVHKAAQYQFLLNTVRSQKRSYSKWEKPIENEDLESVKLFFGYSTAKAVEALRILTEEQIAMVRTKTKLGD